MSYQIYYKVKVFQDKNGIIFVFTLDGSNNSFMFNHRGREISERDWHLFYRGTEQGFKDYCKKIFKIDGIALSRVRFIGWEEWANKVLKMRRTPIEKLQEYFNFNFEMYNYNTKERREATLNDVYNLLEENYFYDDKDGWGVCFIDKTLNKILEK